VSATVAPLVAVPAGAAAAQSPDAGLALVNLHNGPRELAGMLVGCLERGEVLDAFLLAAGLLQIAEDVLEADRLRLADAHRVLSDAGQGLPAAAVSRASSALAALPRGRGPLRAHAADLAPIVDALADMVASGRRPSLELASLASRARSIVRDLPSVPASQAGMLRLPACFRGFDQHPDDVERMVARFAAARPERDAPVAVVGVRTSGSYLAPLTAAYLRAAGFVNASALTMRPSQPIGAGKRRVVREVVRAGGSVIVVDDPPASGGSMARVAGAVCALGAAAEQVVPMFATHSGASVPSALRGYGCITLPWEQWSVHDRLAPDAVARSLERLWPGTRVDRVVRLPLDDSEVRGHVAARYSATVDGHARELFVRGAGLGYLGRHALAVAAELSDWLPPVHGVVDGLAFRDWIPARSRAQPSEAEVAEYAAARARRLALDHDPTPLFAGQDPVWEVASNVLSRAFARGWRGMRISALDVVTRDLLRARRPCVVDGRMDPALWYSGPIKAKADERAYSNRNLACCDAAYDVAAAAALSELDPELLRTEFARASGDPIDGERWLVYQLVAAWAARRDGVFDVAAERRSSARALRRYLADLFLAGLPRRSGDFCALDVDGVLETETLGFPGPSPAGALALRSLIAHGYRPLLASGRSIGEIEDRCRDYGLVGGVAEYGAAVFDSASGETRVLVSRAGERAISCARGALALRPGVEIGTDHLHTIRAWRRDDHGRRGPLLEADIAAAHRAAGAGALRTVPGESQTDIVSTEVNKARGLRALAVVLGSPGAGFALAVGDAVEDVPMLRVAELGIAPANADAAVRESGVRIGRRGYQAGLADAVGELIGHAPGGCMACAARRPSRRAATLMGVLSAREEGPRGLVKHALGTTWRAHAPR
jgi:adenine/guanine phosphoribosyltransferase-like PRPP-binding protein